jgi:hypothetical protein
VPVFGQLFNDETDYDILNNDKDIHRHHKNVNEIYSKIGTIKGRLGQALLGHRGQGRSYHVTGPHICRGIEEKAGK